MNKNGIFDAHAAAGLVNATMDWDDGDIIEFNSRFFSFFRADGKSPDKRKVLSAMVDYWQDVNNQGQKDISSKGFFIMAPGTVTQSLLKKLKIDTPSEPDPIVGVVAADAKALARQFNTAKQILKRLGVCNNDLPCRLRVDTNQEDLLDLRSVRNNTFGTKAAFKLGAKLPAGMVEPGVEFETSSEIMRSLETSREWALDSGAMKSAMLMNRIAILAGVHSLPDLSESAARRQTFLSAFDRGSLSVVGRESQSETIVEHVENELGRLQHSRDAILSKLSDFYSHAQVRMLDQLAPISVFHRMTADPSWMAKWDAMSLSFEEATTICESGQINAEAFQAMKRMELNARSVNPGTWIEHCGDFGAHALLLVACIDEEIEQHQVTLELMEAEMPDCKSTARPALN